MAAPPHRLRAGRRRPPPPDGVRGPPPLPLARRAPGALGPLGDVDGRDPGARRAPPGLALTYSATRSPWRAHSAPSAPRRPPGGGGARLRRRRAPPRGPPPA